MPCYLMFYLPVIYLNLSSFLKFFGHGIDRLAFFCYANMLLIDVELFLKLWQGGSYEACRSWIYCRDVCFDFHFSHHGKFHVGVDGLLHRMDYPRYRMEEGYCGNFNPCFRTFGCGSHLAIYTLAAIQNHLNRMVRPAVFSF